MEPTFIETQQEWHDWLLENHATASEFQIGFYKTKTKKKSITNEEALDEALCFGWIDGVVRGLDEWTWTKRWTPRKPKSIWSLKNIKRVEELKSLGRMHPAGIKAYELREEKRTGVYSFESEPKEFSGIYLETFVANPKAWEFFLSMPKSYRTPATHLVLSAKQEATRMKRLEELIRASEMGERIDSLKSRSWKK